MNRATFSDGDSVREQEEENEKHHHLRANEKKSDALKSLVS
jgi:hypothetical protein|tara:strand:+ start:596 stop:718 length:123 start_codon:yes stop_codon:yes gene_type:complete